MRAAALHTYPIKGCHRLTEERAEVHPWGLAGDRRWLIVDAETGVALTQRDDVRLTRVFPEPLPGGAGLLIRTPGSSDLVVPQPTDGDLLDVTVWSFTGPARRADAAAGDHLSALLDRKVNLMWLDDPTRRAVEPGYAQPGDTVSFADGYPVLLANSASLAQLNDWIAESGSLEGPLPMTRFRPNLVVEGGSAWAEDGWLGGRLRVGGVTFRVAKACARCVVTTTDQETGERGREPLRTLGRYRNVDQGLLFAVNLIPDTLGEIAVGDEVTPL
jgi:uncharacterized protein YcbX